MTEHGGGWPTQPPGGQQPPQSDAGPGWQQPAPPAPRGQPGWAHGPQADAPTQQQPGWQPQPPPPAQPQTGHQPPATTWPQGQPQGYGPPPPSGTGRGPLIAIVAVVAAFVVVGAAVMLSSDDGDETSADDSTTSTTDDDLTTTTTDEPLTTTTSTVAEDEIDPSTGMLPGYSSAIVTTWVDGCSQDGDPTRESCQCAVDTMTTTVPFVDFMLWFTSPDPGAAVDPAIQAALDQCGITLVPQGLQAVRTTAAHA